MASIQHVIFRLDDEEYGLDIMNVYGIEKDQEVVKIPNTPEYIEGIINLRGEILPVYNLRKKFNLKDKQSSSESKIIVTQANNMQVGFVVDSVAEILHIEDEVIEKAPKIITGVDRKYIKSVAKLKDRMVIILDIDLVLNEEEQKTITEAIKDQ